jgi:2-keto-4-pentenoate hydratase/2-oxohepta-3-ene-1,7-dioic acid hydratase in catechol pathway
MRFATRSGRASLVGATGLLDLHDASAGSLPAQPLAALERWDEVRTFSSTVDWSGARLYTPAELGPPVPEPRQVFAIGLNYRPHAAEAGFEPPAQPMVFTKFPSCVAGPDVEVRLPPGNVDWEIEVVAVVGRGGFQIPRDAAWDALAGLTGGQDLSERWLQSAGTPPQFSLGKSYPGFGPTGPVVVTPDELPDRDDVGFASWLDGEPLQQGRTSEMIFSIPELVAWISAVCPLLPGDLIFTGTPGGVGNRMRPPRFLAAGQTLVSRVEQVGEIRQRFQPWTADPAPR